MSYPLRQARPLSIVAIQSDGETDVTLVAPRPEFHDEPLQRVRVFSGRYLWPRGACHCCSNREILITPDNVALVSDLVSPGNFVLVNQGVRMKIVPTERIEWPPPYKSPLRNTPGSSSSTTRARSSTTSRGLPFPFIDSNDPHGATKVMWNLSFRPQYTDDVDIREVEATSYGGRSKEPVEHFMFGLEVR